MVRLVAGAIALLIAAISPIQGALADGAFAVNKQVTPYAYGLITNAKTKAVADKKALAKCGGGACQILTSFANQCVAGAKGTNGYGFAQKSTLSAAKASAILDCKKNTKNCKIAVSGCDGRAK